jgi:hypothetical protein
MSDGQMRVLVLLGVLALLEVAAHPTVKSYFKSVWSSIGHGVAKK